MRAKYINKNKIEYLGIFITIGDKVYTNPERNPNIMPSDLEAIGYLEVINPTPPSCLDDEYIEASYKIVKNKIKCNYIARKIAE
ncbi:MAG: hypothetical protein IJR66_05045 [Clostridia bacterium]|nr:hypothetical protein [Clostridia bacterium]MBQ6979796.1 hypothetical protein [Clostridia bacterium]MBQ9514323.1 hypothetical protein [Clostridia bacterium]